MRAPFWQCTATVDADADRVISLLRERIGNRWIGVATVQALDDGVAVEGGWWFRGEYHVEPLGDSRSRVVYQISNVAPGTTRWMVPLLARRRPAAYRAGFAELMDSIGGGRLEDRPG